MLRSAPDIILLASLAVLLIALGQIFSVMQKSETDMRQIVETLQFTPTQITSVE